MRLPLFISLLISILFIFFQPRLRNYLFPAFRTAYLEQLIQSTKADFKLDAQRFWQTREFYYPGVFYVAGDGLAESHLRNLEKTTGLTLPSGDQYSILVYDSPKWQSYEALVDADSLQDVITLPDLPPIYEDGETHIYQQGDTTYIYFLKSYDELRTTNGFVYRDETNLSRYRAWFGVSKITR